MSDRVEPAYEGKSAVNAIKTESGQGASQFQDNRPEAANLMQLQAMANGSDQVQHTGQLQASANENKQASVVQPKKNNTGLPDNLKSGIENLSGMSMDDVKVHRNSDKPAQLNAHAYAQGTDIHLASGQEKHLPHEAWHVVQQKQGRVKPTTQMKAKVNVNDDAGLEKEADVMGAKASQINVSDVKQLKKVSFSDHVVQRMAMEERTKRRDDKRYYSSYERDKPVGERTYFTAEETDEDAFGNFEQGLIQAKKAAAAAIKEAERLAEEEAERVRLEAEVRQQAEAAAAAAAEAAAAEALYNSNYLETPRVEYALNYHYNDFEKGQKGIPYGNAAARKYILAYYESSIEIRDRVYLLPLGEKMIWQKGKGGAKYKDAKDMNIIYEFYRDYDGFRVFVLTHLGPGKVPY